jgi:VanZ family protein
MLNYKYLYLSLFSTLLIIYASSIPDLALLDDDSLVEQIISNIAHFPAYALLTFLWLKAFERRSASHSFMAAALILFALILFAVSDEIHQSFIPGRSASYMDIGLDLLGIFFGLATFKIFGIVNVSQEE